MTDFWVACGHHLLDRDEAGRLVVTDEFLKAYLARPELVPPPEACDAERALHAELMSDPRAALSPERIAAIADRDARENWTLMLAFRDRLLASPTLESAYLALVADGLRGTPPIFLDQLTQVVLRNALDGCDDPFVMRAGELFFRPQRATFHDGTILLADAETIEAHEHARHSSPLLAMLGGPAVTELEILDETNAATYPARSDAFDMVLNLGGDGRARRALATVLAAWIRHLLGVEVSIAPLLRIDDPDWVWFVGLDAEGTRIGNALWSGEETAANDLLGLFELRFAIPEEALPRIGAKPVYLLLGLTADRLVRLKPQNLIAGLPLRGRGHAS